MIIPGFSDYDIAEDGTVTCISTGRVITPYIATNHGYNKYKRVNLISDSGLHRSCGIIRLLALTYLEKPHENARAVAIDNDQTNAVLSNAKWEIPAYIVQRLWKEQRINRRPRKSICNTEASRTMVFDTLMQYDEPVTMLVLSDVLQVPYSVVRYSIKALIREGKVRKTSRGYEVIK